MGKIICFFIITTLLISGQVFADSSQRRDLAKSGEILSPKQRRIRTKREAFNKKIMSMSYGDLEEAAQDDKKIAKVLKRLNKKGIKNAAHYEQFKAQKKGQMGRKDYPRSWKKTGKNRDDIYKRHSQDIQ